MLGPAEPPAGAALFGVERSLAGKRWRLRPADDRLALALAQRLELPELIGRILAARGVGLEAAADFLNPTLATGLPDPEHLKDMDKAAVRLVAAVGAGERIAVFGDYDVDGATAAALLTRFLAAVGAETTVYIPDRRREGYGPNAPALLQLQRQGAAVAVTVDCGTTAHEALAAAAEAGLDVIVVDHHSPESQLPPAHAVVNPNRLDDASPHGQLAAVGVAFLLVVAVSRRLRQAGWYRDRAEPDLRLWLDLVALGTVCDVVPLTGVNRVLVAQGLKVMAWRGNAGLAALADVAGLDGPPDAYHAGFVLGPRVNAGGRVGEAGMGARLLSTDDPAEARRLAERLNDFNLERRRIEADVLVQAIDSAERQGVRDDPVVFVAGEGLACRRRRHRRQPAGRALPPAGLRGRARRRRRQGLRPLGRRGRSWRRGAGGASRRLAYRRRRPSDGGRLYRGRRGCAGAAAILGGQAGVAGGRSRSRAAPRRGVAADRGDPGPGRDPGPARAVRRRQHAAAFRARQCAAHKSRRGRRRSPALPGHRRGRRGGSRRSRSAPWTQPWGRACGSARAPRCTWPARYAPTTGAAAKACN